MPLKEFPAYVSREKRGCLATQGQWGSIRSGVGAEAGVRGEPGLEPAPGKAGQGRLGLASLNSCGRRWAKGVVSSCLVYGPEMISGRVNIALVCESYIKGVVSGIDLELVSLYITGMLLVSPLLSLRIG